MNNESEINSGYHTKASEFDNAQIAVQGLPRVEEVEWIALSRKYLEYYYGWVVILFLLLLIPLPVLFIAAESWVWQAAAGVWFVAFGLVMLLARQVYKHKAYALRRHDLLYKRGLIIRKITTVPFVRLQHSKIRESGLERAFGLSSLLLYTAGGSSSDLRVPGLLPEEASKIKDYISRKVVESEEEE